MARSPVVQVGISLRDRDGNRAVVTCYCAGTTQIADAYTFALAMIDRVGALSDASIERYSMAWRWTIDDPGIPAESSNIERKMLLLMVNPDDEINGVIVPSPSDNWETTGSYAGIRLDLASAGALAWLSMLGAIDLRTAENHQLGTILAAGGLAY